MSKKYIVVAIDGSNEKFLKLISCDSVEIIRFAKMLGFNDAVDLYFFPIEKLASRGTLTKDSMDVEQVWMSKEKALVKFTSEVEKIIQKLGIEKE